MDRDRAAIHDVPRQTDMLRAISKACFRIWEGRASVGMLAAAAGAALTAPRGPVSLEIPIDVQREKIPRPRHIGIGPIVADGPLAAELAEAAGHLAGGLSRTLERAGLPRPAAEQWEALIRGGAILVGAHVLQEQVDAAREIMLRHGSRGVVAGFWPD